MRDNEAVINLDPHSLDQFRCHPELDSGSPWSATTPHRKTISRPRGILNQVQDRVYEKDQRAAYQPVSPFRLLFRQR